MGMIPWEIADAVILWGRNTGRPGLTVEWNRMLDAPIVKIPWKDNDPRRAVDDVEDPFETVILPRNLSDYGPSGIVEFLQKGDVMSGRGEYEDLHQATVATIERNRAMREERKREFAKLAAEQGKEQGWLDRRKLYDLPQVSVAADISSSTRPAVSNGTGDAE